MTAHFYEYEDTYMIDAFVASGEWARQDVRPVVDNQQDFEVLLDPWSQRRTVWTCPR